jgi:recombination associated protein RdgC
MVCSKRQDKLLPASVINEALEQRAGEIEAREERKMPRKERRNLKDEVIFSLMPRAFARSSLVFAYISPRDNLLVVDAASAKRAEALIDELREALGSLSLIPLAPKNLPIEVMTQWLNSGQPTQGFALGEECELRDNADISNVIRCKNQDLTAVEMLNHLKTGMHVSKLALSWQNRVECLLDEKLSIKRLRFSDRCRSRPMKSRPKMSPASSMWISPSCRWNCPLLSRRLSVRWAEKSQLRSRMRPSSISAMAVFR